MRIIGRRGKPIPYVCIEFDDGDRDESMQKLAEKINRFVDGSERELTIGFAADSPRDGRLGRLDAWVTTRLLRRRSHSDIVVHRG
jgi:hypothetical protein